MKYLYGKSAKLCAVMVTICIMFFNMTVFASDNKVEFILTSENCGSNIIEATYGKAWLSASADGITKEKIKWDDDTTILAPRMQGKKLTSGWNIGGYWMLNINANNLKNLKFSADMFSSGKGPKNFEMYYSIDGENFNMLDNSEIELSKKNRTVYNNFSLPSSIDGQKNVYIKIMISSEFGVNGNIITGLKDGSTYINNIIISADNISDSGGDEKKDDKEENPEKSYYTTGKNIEMSRIGMSTGKYKFSISIMP